MSLLKILGSLCLLLFSFLMAESECQRLKENFAHLEGIVFFLRFIREEIGTYLTPCDGIFQKFRNDGLESCGFLPLLRDGKTLSEALVLSREKLSIPETVSDVFTAYADRIGQGYREEEIKRAEQALSEIMPIYEKERDALPKNLRLVRILLLSGAVMLILCLL